MKPIVIAEQIRKKYSLHADANRHYGVADLFRELTGRRSSNALRPDEFWAVDGISFYLNPGDSIALVGRNGSGKSTMLKLLAGLIKPDDGVIQINGRVQGLINLGAGFSPRLSGRENIMNGAALMGLSRKRTLAIMDEIVDFAELGEFIDSPVSTYSSGMYARLGFSVAVHLDPQILLIDEILSVGDFAFQNKCFVKMHEIKKRGATIVLVSHSFTHVNQICDQALWLDRGRLVQAGAAGDVTKAYMEHLEARQVDELKRLNEAQAGPSTSRTLQGLYGPIYDEFDKISDLEFSFSSGGGETDVVRTHDELQIEYRFTLNQPVTDLNVSLVFIRKDGLWMTAISTLNGDLVREIHDGQVHCRVRIADCHLNPGNYVLVMPVHEGKSYLWRNIVKEFVVVSRERFTWHLTDFDYSYEVLNGSTEGPLLTEHSEAAPKHAADASTSPNDSVRPLHFPYEYSMGTLRMRPAGSTVWEWEDLGEAIGRVFAPRDKELLLVVGADAAGRLFGLSRLAPDDLFGLHLARTPVRDQDLAHLARFTGLRTLELRHTEITDRALESLAPLRSLKTLALPATISEKAMNRLRETLPGCTLIQN
ncbi:MAG: ATP-binding cassette domain-containing protein [Candidatus Sumerlaeia bacterium]